MKSKLIFAFIICLIFVFSFVACKSENDNKVDNIGDGNNLSDNKGDNNEPPKEENSNVIYDSNTDVALVIGSDITGEHVEEVAEILTNKAKSVIWCSGNTQPMSHEIILGRTEREISVKAYRILELEEKGEDYVGYCIYSDGKSVALAFDEEIWGVKVAENAAVDVLIREYLSADSLTLGAGLIKVETFNAIEYQAKLDEERLNAEWAELEIELSRVHGDFAKDMVASLRELYTIYDDQIIDWFANLYDPVTGGYYFSNSARNSEGYLPDVESTSQALGFLLASGITDNLAEFIPKEMQQQIVSFVKSLQSPENGHFYHPQWGKELTDKYPARLGRDVGNATRILAYFGAIPTYDAPNGTKGENRVGVTPASALTGKLNSSSVISVSNVIAASDAGVESYLLNEENFREFLKKYDEKIKTDAYWVGNEFESIATQIVARDKVLKERGEKYSLAKIATDWFTSHIDPETGLWEPYEDNEYDCVNGILKISSAYTKLGYEVPGALDLLDYAIRAITSDADPHHVCCVLNTWYALTVLTSNLKAHSSTADEDIASLRNKYIDTYPEMVRATKEKFSLFVKDVGTSAGAFSYFQDRTSSTSQGLKVALENSNEGDINSSYICSAGVMGHIWDFIGAESIDLYTTADGMRYKKILASLGPIIKEREIDPIPIDFEDVGDIQELIGDGFMSTWLPQGELVVESGKPYGEISRVMRLTTIGKNDLFQLNITKPQGMFNAVAFESDIMFDPKIESTYELLMFSSTSSIRHVNFMLKAIPGDGVYIYGIDFDEVKIAECGEWFNLRVEYGKLNNVTIEMDVIVNNKIRATGSAPYGNECLEASILTRIQFSAYHGATTEGSVYFDNMFLEQFIKDLPTLPDVELGPTEEETGILTFENKVLNAYINSGTFSIWLPGGTLSIIDAMPNGAASKVLELVTSGKDGDLFQLMLTKNEENYNAISFCSDIMFNTTAPSVFEVLVFGTTQNRGTHILLSTDENGVYVYTDDVEKTRVASLGEWFNLEIVYTKVNDKKVCVEIFKNGASVAISTAPYDISNVPVPKDIYRIQFASYHESTADGAVYFDNMSLLQINYLLPELPEYEEPTGPSESETGILTFDERTLQGYKNAKLLDYYTENGSFKILDGKLHGWDSNVLELTSPGKGSNLFQLNVTKAADQSNALVFETDIMFFANAPSVYELLFFGSVSANKGGHILFSANDDGVFVHGDDFELARIASLGEHFKLKVVYTKVDDARVCMEVVVNGVTVAISTSPFNSTVFDAADITRIQFSSYHNASATGAVYFDNMGLLRFMYEVPELPETNEPEPDPTPEPDPEPDPIPTPTPDGDSPYDGDEDVANKDWT